MNRSTKPRIATGLLTLMGVLAVGAPAALTAQSSQSSWFRPTDANEFRLGIEKPFLESDFGAFTTVWDADVAIALSGGRSLTFGVPFAFGTADDADGSATFGNLRATLSFGTPDARSAYIGVVLPTSFSLTDQEYARFVGFAGRIDQVEDWIEDGIALRGGLVRSRPAGAGRVGFRLAGAAVSDTDFEDPDFWTRGGVWGRTRTGSVALHGEVSGAWLVTEDGGFGPNSVFYVDAGVDFEEVGGRPGIFVRIPLDDTARGPIDLSLGVRVIL